MSIPEKQKESGTSLASKAREITSSTFLWLRLINPAKRPVERPEPIWNLNTHSIKVEVSMLDAVKCTKRAEGMTQIERWSTSEGKGSPHVSALDTTS